MEDKRPLIVVVGNCCSGKTTLAHSLIDKGYNAKAVLQEHAISKKMWQRAKPDLLIHLSCNLDTAKQRRSFSWGQKRLDDQKILLSNAYENADLKIVTDSLSITEVCEIAVEFIEKRGKYEGNNI